ncbi:unnamed protein product [Heterobilharzia americana]|nr:unnamed protein product [Heterobilharzia americana]
MSDGYTPSLNRWTGNKSPLHPPHHHDHSGVRSPTVGLITNNLIISEDHISRNQELYPNASRMNNHRQNLSPSPFQLKKQQQQQRQQHFINDALKPSLHQPKSPPIQCLRSHQPVIETYRTVERSSPPIHFHTKCNYLTNPLIQKDNLRPTTIRDHNRYNPIQFLPSTISSRPESSVYRNQDYQCRSYPNSCLPSNTLQKLIRPYEPRASTTLSPIRRLSSEISQSYMIHKSPENSIRKISLPCKTNLIDNDNDEPDIWNIGSTTLECKQPIYYSNQYKSNENKFSLYNQKHHLMDIPKKYNYQSSIKHLKDYNMINSECGSLLSTDEETVSLNTIDSEQNVTVFNRHSISLQKININQPDIYASIKTLVTNNKPEINRFNNNSLSSSCKSVHWSKNQTSLINNSTISTGRKTEEDILLHIQGNKVLDSVNLPIYPCPTSVFDQPTTFTETIGDDFGDKWTVYYRNPNIPSVKIESVNNESSNLLDLSIPNSLSLKRKQSKRPFLQSNNTIIPNHCDKFQLRLEVPEQSIHRVLPKLMNEKNINKISLTENTKVDTINLKQKHKYKRLYSIKQTECLIEAIECLTNSIERNNLNIELEYKERQNLFSLDQRKSSPIQHNDVIYHRNSSLTGRIPRQRNYNTKYGVVNRHEYRRKSATMKCLEELTQNRTEKVAVEVRVVFLKIGEIDTLKEFYYADAFLQAKWREPRLDGHTAEELSITELEQYWNPLLYIDNILSETKETQWLMAVSSENGEVYLMERRRIKGVFLETLELNDFPLDVQDLTITVTTERPDTEVDIIPDQVEMSAINIQTFVDQQEWKLHEHVEIKKRIIKQEYTSSMKSHPCLSVTCRAARRPGYFYWNVFLIMFMISGLAFATFAVSPDKAELRLRLSFTLILTSVTFKYVITQSLPKISYLTYMDKYVLMSLFILCIISIWHAVVTLIGLDFDLPDSGGFSSSVSTTQPMTIIPPPGVSSTYQGPRIVFPHRNTSLPVSSSLLKSAQHGINQTLSDPSINISNYDFVNISQSVGTMNTSYILDNNHSTHNFSSISSSFSSSSLISPSSSFVYNHQFDNDPTKSTTTMTTNDNHTFSSLLKEQSSGCSRTNRMACSDWKMVQQIEQHVFTSFVTIYILAHAIFIFWLYFDASRRRREMRQKDKDYRATKRPINQGNFVSATSL